MSIPIEWPPKLLFSRRTAPTMRSRIFETTRAVGDRLVRNDEAISPESRCVRNDHPPPRPILSRWSQPQPGERSSHASGQDGLYSFSGLKPGLYDAIVQADGFRTLTRSAIVLNVHRRAAQRRQTQRVRLCRHLSGRDRQFGSPRHPRRNRQDERRRSAKGGEYSVSCELVVASLLRS